MGPNKCIFPQSAEIQYICWLTGIVEPKNFWKSDRCWEPQIPKFECYWKLWKLGRVGLKIALSLYNGTFGDQMTKLLFSPLSLYYGTFGGPFNQAHWQSGPKIAVFHNQHVQWYIWWPTDKVVPKISLFPSLSVLWYIWWPTDKVVPKIALFTVQTV